MPAHVWLPAPVHTTASVFGARGAWIVIPRHAFDPEHVSVQSSPSGQRATSVYCPSVSPVHASAPSQRMSGVSETSKVSESGVNIVHTPVAANAGVQMYVGCGVGATVLPQHASNRPLSALGQHVPDVRPAATQRGWRAHAAHPSPHWTLSPKETLPGLRLRASLPAPPPPSPPESS